MRVVGAFGKTDEHLPVASDRNRAPDEGGKCRNEIEPVLGRGRRFFIFGQIAPRHRAPIDELIPADAVGPRRERTRIDGGVAIVDKVAFEPLRDQPLPGFYASAAIF